MGHGLLSGEAILQGADSPSISMECRIISILDISEILDGVGDSGNEASNGLAPVAVKPKRLGLVLGGGLTSDSSCATFHVLHQFLMKVLAKVKF